MTQYIAEAIGVFILITIGNGTVANVFLKGTKGNGSGWMTIATGWGLAVMVAEYVVGGENGVHVNPAVTVGFAVIGELKWHLVPGYVFSQILGGVLGGIAVYYSYYSHFKITEDPKVKLAVFSTPVAIDDWKWNILTEAIGAFMLVFGVCAIKHINAEIMSSFLIGVLVWAIGLSLGGPVGYAINPARDIGPRIAHAILPIQGKGSSHFKHGLLMTTGPFLGGVLGALVWKLLEFIVKNNFL